MQMQIKITFNNETKKLRKVNDYDNLRQQAEKSFNLDPKVKLFYMDSEGDMISITSQDDFEEAMDCMKNTQTLRLICETNGEAAKKIHEGLIVGDSSFRNS